MSPNDPPAEFGLSWQMREHESRLLADSLRSARLTLLYAAAGSSRSALLSEGVLPLLGRREADQAVGGFRESRVVAPFIDRRDPGERAGEVVAGSERVVYFSDWGSDPLSALLAKIRASIPGEALEARSGERLADAVEAMCERFGMRLLIVLDAFERFLATGAGAAQMDRFVDGFGEAVDRPHLPVHFLLVVDDRWEGKLDAFRSAIRGFDDSTVRLLGLEPAHVGDAPRVETEQRPLPRSPPRTVLLPPVVTSSPPTLLDAVLISGDPKSPAGPSAPPPRPRRVRPVKTPVAPPAPIGADGVYAFIESTLSQTADDSEPWHDLSALPMGVMAPPPPVGSNERRSGADRPGASLAERAFVGRSPALEPPSPIDDWLDAAIAWCRRRLRSRR